MTAEQKEKIISLRRENYGYSAIANRLGLSKDSVKAFCRSHGLAGIKACTVETPVITTNTCLNCGALLCQTANGKQKKFCCTACRQIWWNAHQDLVKRKAIYPFVCSACGRHFTAYGNSHRKYCSHACYVSFRFKGGAAV